MRRDVVALFSTSVSWFSLLSMQQTKYHNIFFDLAAALTWVFHCFVIVTRDLNCL